MFGVVRFFVDGNRKQNHCNPDRIKLVSRVLIDSEAYLNMKTAKLMVSSFLVAAAAMAGVAVAQSAADKYIISAKAGGINYVEGSVVSLTQDGVGSRAFKGDRLEVEERLQTGANSRAEVLLNPGSYVRLGSNAELSIVDDSLDNLRLRVSRGAAMFEIFATKDFTVSVVTDGGDVVLSRSGIYRVNASHAGTTKVEVFEGRASLSSNRSVSAGSGKALSVSAGSSSVSQFDRKKLDGLAQWSKDRGRSLAEATATLRNRDVRNVLISSFNMGRWNMWDTFGLWVYDIRRGGFCFLPFGYGWNSPYGFFYGHGINWYNLPVIIRNIPATPNPTTGTPAPPSGQDGTKVRTRPSAPAYSRIESDRRNTPIRMAPEVPPMFGPQPTGTVRMPAPLMVESAPPAQNTSRPRRP